MRFRFRAFCVLLGLALPFAAIGCTHTIDYSGAARELVTKGGDERRDVYTTLTLLYSRGKAAEVLGLRKDLVASKWEHVDASDMRAPEKAFRTCVAAARQETHVEFLRVLLRPMLFFSLDQDDGSDLGRKCFDGLENIWVLQPANKPAFREIVAQALRDFRHANTNVDSQGDSFAQRRLLFLHSVGSTPSGTQQLKKMLLDQDISGELRAYAVLQVKHLRIPSARELLSSLVSEDSTYIGEVLGRLFVVDGEGLSDAITTTLKTTGSPDVLKSVVKNLLDVRYGRYHSSRHRTAIKRLLGEALDILRIRAKADSRSSIREAATQSIAEFAGRGGPEIDSYNSKQGIPARPVDESGQ